MQAIELREGSLGGMEKGEINSHTSVEDGDQQVFTYFVM